MRGERRTEHTVADPVIMLNGNLAGWATATVERGRPDLQIAGHPASSEISFDALEIEIMEIVAEVGERRERLHADFSDPPLFDPKCDDGVLAGALYPSRSE